MQQQNQDQAFESAGSTADLGAGSFTVDEEPLPF